MFVLIAGFLVSRGVNVKVMPPVEVVLVSICVNVSDHRDKVIPRYLILIPAEATLARY